MTEKEKQLANAPTYDNEVYVGPEWIREGKHVDQPMLDGQDRGGRKYGRLTEEEIIARAGCKYSPHPQRAKVKSQAYRELSHSFYWFLVPALIALACAAYLFDLILKGLK